jgi:hypothetical protein
MAHAQTARKCRLKAAATPAFKHQLSVSDGLKPLQNAFPSLLRRQEPSLKHSFSCRIGRRHQNGNNQAFDLIVNLLFSEICKTSKALLSTGHPPARLRQIFGFAKVSAFYISSLLHACHMRTVTLR